ncbi:hypothetical protein [Candidatus Berkiella aquae]|uniref:Uncharacterized protein n=1 Tax=Candidatus Berkiella aquae TaxID=295108 RepID=A0A0Q9YVZ7_9GAMM|nr:hypothetical protein [Candidatus Berkiella aquae]MCS5710419.1 hypothetical protein [Candidatus Berkiella aquae]
MRTLSNNEINQISGASYQEDIITAAASIYVGSAIGSAASSITAATFAGAANVFSGTCAAPLGFALGTLSSVITPIMFVAAPVLVFDAVYPGVIAEKVEAYFN